MKAQSISSTWPHIFLRNKIQSGLFSVYSVSVPGSWAENSNRIIQRSQTERSKSAQLRSDSDNLINQTANDIWNAWNATNNALSRRASETLEAKAKLQMHLHKVNRKQLKYSMLSKNLMMISSTTTKIT
jgi:tektin-3